MGFQQGLSGLNVSAKALDVVSNNIANVNTVGFKTSTTLFADVYAASMSGASQVGIGATVTDIAQQFTQGNITITNNTLDLAINGQGFYRLNSNGATTWSRNGQFHVDKNGYIVNATGNRLTGYLADPTTSMIIPSTPADIRIDTSDLQPQATGASAAGTGLEIGLNLDSRDPVITVAFNPSNPTTYNNSTSATVYDSLGNSHLLSMYFVKTAANTWNLYTAIDGGSAAAIAAANATGATPASVLAAVQAAAAASGTTADANAATAAAAAAALPGATANTVRDAANNAAYAGPTALAFSTTGALITPATGTISQSHGVISGATNPLSFPLNLTGSTQFGNIFGVNSIYQDGYTSGRLAGLSVADDGTIQGRYSNGQTRDLAQVVLGNFTNPNGLQSLGNNQWAETADSGQPLIGEPGSGSLGVIQSAAVEESNVDLTAELVNMITYQRSYQANAQTIRTQDQILQTLVNLR